MAEGKETAAETQPESEPAPALRPGGQPELLPATVIDRYQIEHRLGAGGMGVVYAARDIHLGRAVAIKVVGSRIEIGSGQGRLVREARAMARLRHPNLATVYDIGVSNDRLFVVMELVDGGTVADWLAAAPRTWRAIIAVFLQAARGLSAAHAAGFVHRDFKPENVLLGGDGVARVCDFGVARILGDEGGGAEHDLANHGSATRTVGVVGTPGYIAPEILRHGPVDGRADQFSFCVAVYASLYGERPFGPRSGPSRITETLGPLRRAPSGSVPRWLHRILARGLAVEPAARWPTLDALAAAITRRLGRRRRAIIGAAVALVAVAAAVLGTIGRRSPPAPPTDWSPVVIGRETQASPLRMVVSPDGSTMASISPSEAWVEPRTGGGTRRRVGFPVPAEDAICKLSHTGDRLFCSFELAPGTIEIWALDVATGHAERRVPSIARPALRPDRFFDVGRDESILFGVDFTAVWRAGPGGALDQVLAAAPGELIPDWASSPDGARIAYRVRTRDGARIEVVATATGATTVVSHRICKDLQWLSEHSLVCAPRAFRNPVVVELVLATGDGPATERVRYNGPEYQQVSGLIASASGLLLSTSPNDQHLGLFALDGLGGVPRIASGGVTDLPAVGWTSSGVLIFGASVRGQLRIMARQRDGRVETVRAGPVAEVPLAVLGESVIFGRFPGGESTIPFFETPFGRRFPDGELFRLAGLGGAVESLGATRGFAAVICAGGQATPCVLLERSDGDLIAIAWDPTTGTRGPVRARWAMTSYAAIGALSPDGRTLAQVRRVLGRGELSLLDLERGDRRRVVVPGTSLDYPRWQPDGTLLAMSSTPGQRGIVRVGGGDRIEMVVAVPGSDEPLTAPEDFLITPDGTSAVVLMTDRLQTHWWISSPGD